MKRKFDMAIEAEHNPATKQIKLATWSEVMDVDMSDVSPSSSPGSDCASLPSAPIPVNAEYPAFQLYPSVEELEFTQNSPSIGLLQPTGFTHNNGTCSMIPKLRIACESGLSGRRTMWSFCEECGAIAIVD